MPNAYDVNWGKPWGTQVGSQIGQAAQLFQEAYNQQKERKRRDEETKYQHEQDRLKHEQDLEQFAVQKKQIAAQEAQLRLDNARKERALAWDELESRKNLPAPVEDMNGLQGPPAEAPVQDVQIPASGTLPAMSVKPTYREDVLLAERAKADELARAQQERDLKKQQEEFRYSERLIQSGRPAPAKAPKPYTDKRTGSVVYLSDEQAMDAGKEGWLAPPPTSDMRNNAYQAGAIEPAFDLVSRSLDNFEKEQKGSGLISQMIPGTAAFYAKDHYITQARALLGAIVARQAGEGSRLSDEDRVAYSQAAGLVNSTLSLPGGAAEARKRMNEARKLLDSIQSRRAISGAGAGAPSSTPSQTPPSAAPIDLTGRR